MNRECGQILPQGLLSVYYLHHFYIVCPQTPLYSHGLPGKSLTRKCPFLVVNLVSGGKWSLFPNGYHIFPICPAAPCQSLTLFLPHSVCSGHRILPSYYAHLGSESKFFRIGLQNCLFRTRIETAVNKNNQFDSLHNMYSSDRTALMLWNISRMVWNEHKEAVIWSVILSNFHSSLWVDFNWPWPVLI